MNSTGSSTINSVFLSYMMTYHSYMNVCCPGLLYYQRHMYRLHLDRTYAGLDSRNHSYTVVQLSYLRGKNKRYVRSPSDVTVGST